MLDKQDDNIQPWHTPFPILNKSVVPSLILTVASWPAYRYLTTQVRWSGTPISLRICHSCFWPTRSKAFVYLMKQKKMFFWDSLAFCLWSKECWQFEVKRHLLLGRKAMTNLESLLKSRDITLPTKVPIVKAMIFPVVMYGCESWTTKKAEHWGIDAFDLWCRRRL